MDELSRANAEVKRQYAKIPGVFNLDIPPANSVDDVIRFAQYSNAAFDNHRHDKSIGDRIRTTIGNNLGVMSTVVNNFAGAATTSFPPCAPVFTAFNYVVKAANSVKADYDTLDSFFTDVGSQLGNITIIKDAIKSIGQKQLSDAVGSIYAAALTASAFAIRYMRKNRVLKGLKALMSGSDKELADAYAKLGVASKKLQEVVNMYTLNVAESGRLETREGFAQVQTGLDQLIKGKDSPVEKLKKYFGASFKGLKADAPSRKLLKGTGQWLFEENRYLIWENGDIPCLWISGSQGCGKTYLAAGVVEHLQTKFDDQKRTAVASCFFSDDRDESASVKRALIEAILQVARIDKSYGKSVLGDLDEEDPRDFQDSSVEDIWEQFFVKYYSQVSNSSSMKLWLIMDGLDTAMDLDRARSDLLKLIGSISTQGLAIHVMLLGQPSLSPDVRELIPESDCGIIEISSENNSGDMALFIDSQMGERRFKTFNAETLATIRDKLSKRKNFSYVRSALQEISQQTQDDDALDQLKKLPREFGDLIQRQIGRVGKDLAEKKLESLRYLLHWVAHARRPLTVQEARAVILLNTTYKDYSVQKEVQARFAGIISIQSSDEDSDLRTLYTSKEAPVSISNDAFLDEPEDIPPDDSSEVKPASLETDSVTETQTSPTIKPEDPDSESTVITLEMEDSIVEYFEAASQPTSGLITKSSDARLDLATTTMHIMCVNDQDSAWTTKILLENYAATFWIQHLQSVDIATCSATQIAQVIESLHDIFEKPNRTSSLFEAYSNDIYSGFNAAIDPKTPVRSLIVKWCHAARGLPLPQLLMDWIIGVTENSTNILDKLAREHLEHWMKQASPELASYIFETLLRCIAAMGWDANLPAPNYAAGTRSEQEIKYVSSLFPDISRDSHAHHAVGVTFSVHGHYDLAIAQFGTSLDLAVDDSHRVCSWIERAFAFQKTAKYDLACKDIDKALNDEFEEAREERTEEAHAEFTDEELSMSDPNVSGITGRYLVSKALSTERRLKGSKPDVDATWLLRAYTIRAECLVAQSKYKAAVNAYKQAVYISYREDRYEEWINLFLALLIQFDQIGDYRGLLQLVKALAVDERIHFMWQYYYLVAGGDDLLCRAAKLSGRKEDLLGLLKELRQSFIAQPAQHAACSYRIAFTHWRVFDNEDAAYNDLNKVRPDDLDITEYSGRAADFSNAILCSISVLLAEIVFSRIYSSPVKWVKHLLIHDLERVSASVLEKQGDISTPWALRAAKGSCLIARAYLNHGKTYEGLERLKPMFEKCIETLTDDDGDNDCASFQLLARVLAYAAAIEPAMMEQAQISYSLQFSMVDPRFKAIIKDETSTSATEKTPAPLDEDLDPSAQIYCDGCDSEALYSKWDRRMYTCLVCVDVDLCRDCYDKRIQANEANEAYSGWKNYCGLNHDYLEGPIAGWGGVKDGIISLGQEKIKFGHWLEDLKSKWEELSLRMPPRRKTMLV